MVDQTMSEWPQDANDHAVFDRLVDGELSTKERQQLLASLDSSDDGWRRCALAFVEAQSWGQQFKQFVAETEEKPIAQLASSPTINTAIGARWLAMVAGIMLAFTAGWLARAPTSTDPVAGQIVEINPQDSQPIDKMPGDALSDDDTVTLYVRDTRGKNQRLRVPLIEAADFGVDSKNSSSSLPAGVLQQLRDGGFDVKRRRRFAPMFFEQNERVVPMVIPVDDMYIVPVRRPVY